jgi:acetylornithine/succinyldiaminopimelate/putrescine aminotransferase
MNLRKLFLLNMAQTSDTPLALEFIKAKGVYFFDAEGKKYLDLISGIGVSNMGHGHSAINDAIKSQVDLYLHQMVYGEYVQSPQVRLATELIKTLETYSTNSEETIDNVYFVNSGAEAVEGAMKLAKRYTGRPEIIAFHHAYHGSTQGAMSLGDEEFRQNYRPLLPGIRKIERENFKDLKQITTQTAAVLFELIGGESGVRVSDPAYVEALANRCRETGTLLVFDEIQSGFGRTGPLWAFEHYNILPDILLTAKAMGGGMPLGAFMAPRKIMSVFKENPILGHITTFGGHPVSCAASLAALKVFQQEIDPQETEKKGLLFKELLRHPEIKEVRGKGLMLAAELSDFDFLLKVISKTVEKSVITDWFLYCNDSMRIAPPLTISEDEIRFACRVILEAIEEAK